MTKRKGAVPPGRSRKGSSSLLIGIGLVFATGVGFAVGYTVGKKSSQMQPMQLVGSREKPRPTQPRPQPPPEPTGPVKIAVAAHSPTKGPADAPVTIIEFSEFQ